MAADLVGRHVAAIVTAGIAPQPLCYFVRRASRSNSAAAFGGGLGSKKLFRRGKTRSLDDTNELSAHLTVLPTAPQLNHVADGDFERTNAGAWIFLTFV